MLLRVWLQMCSRAAGAGWSACRRPLSGVQAHPFVRTHTSLPTLWEGLCGSYAAVLGQSVDQPRGLTFARAAQVPARPEAQAAGAD